MDLQHTERRQLEPADIARIHAALESNSHNLRYAFNEVREWSEYLRQQLKNKKLNRADLVDSLLEFSELADLGHSLLRDRMRLEQRFTAHCYRYPATSEKQKTKQTPGKAGSHG